MILRRAFVPCLASGLLLLGAACSRKGDDKGSSAPGATCGSALARDCEDLQKAVAQAQADRDQAIAGKDVAKAVAAQMEADHKTELLDLYRVGQKGGAEQKALDERYARRQSLLKDAPAGAEDSNLAPSACEGGPEGQCARLTQDIRALLKERASLTANAAPGQDVELALALNYRLGLVSLIRAGKHDGDEVRALVRDHDYVAVLLARIRRAVGVTASGGRGAFSCPEGLMADCRDLESELVLLRRDQEAALAAQDLRKASTLAAQINYKNELLELYLEGKGKDSEEVRQLDARYGSLRMLLAGGSISRPYSEREALAVREVFKDFGDLYVNETNGLETASAEGGLPWSEFWYPARSEAMYSGSDAPLAKFDRLVSAMGGRSDAVQWEKDRHDPFAAEWEGLCDAWAIASMLAPEPKTGLSYHGVTFSISDIKALYIKKFEGYKPKIYGLRYSGSEQTDGEMQDLRPEAFHRIVEAVIKERKQFIGLDDDPHPEVWNKPMYRMDWKITKDPSQPNAFLVSAFPKMIRNRNKIEPRLTSSEDMKAPQYDYRLFVDPNQQRDGKFRVIYGEWVGRSADDHPDFVFLPQAQELKPVNPEFAKNLAIFDKLLGEGVPAP